MANILYVGPDAVGSTSRQRKNVLEGLGHRVRNISTSPPERASGLVRRAYDITQFLHRQGRSKRIPGLVPDFSRQILSALRSDPFEILWVDKGILIARETLEEAKRVRPDLLVVGLVLDAMTMPHNQTRVFTQALPAYDVMITNKSFEVPFYEFRGVKRTYFMDNCYHMGTHRPVTLTANEQRRFGADLSFVGEHEWQREISIYRLGEAGLNGLVIGAWQGCRQHENFRYSFERVWGDDYAKAICGSKIQLGFLRHINQDTQTTRSVEIPACGVFMLAERSDEHEALFAEGKEAAYFDSDEELVDKARYYLAHEDERAAIARAGHERCVRDGYSYRARLTRIMAQIDADFGRQFSVSP